MVYVVFIIIDDEQLIIFARGWHSQETTTSSYDIIFSHISLHTFFSDFMQITSMFKNISRKQIGFAGSSALLGAWAFYKVNSISGPAFEPIIAACTNPDYAGNMEEFVSKTGYHAYEPMVGLKVFNFLVCLITQFLLELRQTHPAGLLTWGGVILVSLAASPLLTIEAGRKGARGIILYPIILGLLYQLFGISVMFPLVYVPAYILGRGSGPVSTYRAKAIVPMTLPGVILTVCVFGADTDSYLWMLCAGILGGPCLALSGISMWIDVIPSSNEKNKQLSIELVKKACYILTFVGVIGWYASLYITYNSYATGNGFVTILKSLWDDIWVNANASVAFMTIDTGVLYVGILLLIAYIDAAKALKAIALLPLMGPAGASYVFAELEETRYYEDEKEKEA